MTASVSESGANSASTVEPGLQEDQSRIDRAWLRIGAGLVIAAQAMVFTLAINAEEIEGAWVRTVLHTLLIASAAGALAFLGGDLLREAWRALRQRRVTIDLLFLVTLLGAFGGSLLNTFRGTGSVYYEVVAILIVVHTVGRMLTARSRVAALQAVARTRADFAFCRRIKGETEERLRVTEVQAGDRVRVSPGEAIPVDGTVVSGRSFVQETAMTGEWKPQAKQAGDAVLAGSHALDGDLEIRAHGGSRQLDRILAAVEEARLAPSDVQAQADRLTAWFLPVVIGAAVLTAAYWWGRGPWEVAVFNSMAVLLVACPCAMGLATPVAIWGALARLTRWGVVARTGDFVACIGKVDTVVFDKTGTLSREELQIVGWRFAAGVNEAEVREIVARLEYRLNHPVARVLAAAGPEVDGPAEARQILAGRGVVGVWREKEVAAGDATLGQGAPDGDRSGKLVHLFVDQRWVACAVLGETWREGLGEVREQLRALNIDFEVLSGDPRAEEALGTGWRVRGGVTAEDKAERVRELRRAGRQVLFIGDGVNDAAALCAANVALSLQGGTELARASAAAVFSGADLRFLPRAIELGRATLRGVRRNLIFSFAYNVAGMILAASGHLHPVAAALLMVGSSAIVSLQALQSSRVRADERLLP